MVYLVSQLGRIVNRFSRDQYSVDESLPFMLNIFLAQVRHCDGCESVIGISDGVWFCVLRCTWAPLLAVIWAFRHPAGDWLRNTRHCVDRGAGLGCLLLFLATQVPSHITRAEASRLSQSLPRLRALFRVCVRSHSNPRLWCTGTSTNIDTAAHVAAAHELNECHVRVAGGHHQDAEVLSCQHHLNRNQRATFVANAGTQWLALRLQVGGPFVGGS